MVVPGSRISGTMYSLLRVLQVLLLVTLSCHARVISTPRQARLSHAESVPYYYYNNIDGNPGSYSYGYDVADPATGNTQYKTEERYPNGTVVGSYGYVDAWGKPQHYRYIADEGGYRVMRDRPIRHQYVPTTATPALYLGSSSTESTVTWTRKPNKKTNKNKFNIYRPNNFILPPSYYAVD